MTTCSPGDDRANMIWGGDGDDTIDGLGGDDMIYGGAGDDMVTGGDGADMIMGGDGDDMLDGGTGYDRTGADMIMGGAGNDTIKGGFNDHADDMLTGGPGGDTFVFGRHFGNDTITDFTNGSDALQVDPSLTEMQLQAVLDNRVYDPEKGAIVLDFAHAGVPSAEGTITLMGYDLSDDLQVGELFDLT